MGADNPDARDSPKLLKNRAETKDTLSDGVDGRLLNKGTLHEARNTTETEPPPLWLSKRLLVSIILFISFVDFHLVRNNINITIVEMTRNKTYSDGNWTITEKPDFDWDPTTVGVILSMLSYGGLFSVFGGFLSDRIGASANCAMCMMVAGILTVLHPAILYLDFYTFLVTRFITGIFESFFYVSTIDVYARWFPRKERSMLISFSFNGTNAGFALVYPFCGFIAHRWSWQMVFYVTGIISIVLSIVFWVLVKNDPSVDTWITKRERRYLSEETDGAELHQVNHPYKKIFTSIPVWNLCMILFVHTWLVTVTGITLPQYVKDMTQKETDEIGLISFIPNVVYLFMFPIVGTLMDYWKNHTKTTMTLIHKTMIVIAFIPSSISFVAAAISCDFTTVMVLFVIIQIITASVPLIIEIISINLSPEHCSVLSALSCFFYSIGIGIAQTITGFMTSHGSLQEWNNCFYLAGVLTTICAIIFAISGSSETQPWSVTTTRNT